MNLTFKDEHRPSVQTFQIISEGRILANNVSPDLAAWIKELITSAERYKQACIKQNHGIEQILGRALNYPLYADDQKTFPGAAEDDGVCVFDLTAEILAIEAARKIQELTLRAKRDSHQQQIDELERDLQEMELSSTDEAQMRTTITNGKKQIAIWNDQLSQTSGDHPPVDA